MAIAAHTPAGPRPTRIEASALEVIARGRVTVTQTRTSAPLQVSTPVGAPRIRTMVLEALVRRGWAEYDMGASLYRGQSVTITEAGRAWLSRG